MRSVLTTLLNLQSLWSCKECLILWCMNSGTNQKQQSYGWSTLRHLSCLFVSKEQGIGVSSCGGGGADAKFICSNWAFHLCKECMIVPTTDARIAWKASLAVSTVPKVQVSFCATQWPLLSWLVNWPHYLTSDDETHKEQRWSDEGLWNHYAGV